MKTGTRLTIMLVIAVIVALGISYIGITSLDKLNKTTTRCLGHNCQGPQ